MKIGIASDHRGYALKGRIIALLRNLEQETYDFGPDTPESVDYPDFGSTVASAVSRGELDRGILICGTGMGMAIVANKFDGVLAAPCHDDITAEMARMHNDANVLCLSSDLLGDRLVNRMVEIFLKTDFEGGRHARRIAKIRQYEADARSTAESRSAEAQEV
ncbi:ribose 5-phosphate isomerase B [Stratiformator vulcanicus]|uniref:Sugar phosphate isomerase YwlF n=1 Tax=Stratiformator vulcanicus TaxID=2527980 RepID=A0A517R357_9PLAN|nr:ribose 5-phosphate isomerase B [Stratiformator vulcanicus]QDT38316.1 Putative sugar phosphate isomerase YwlF [Stratiformator vulcanicus]